jgi:hypothetical protein
MLNAVTVRIPLIDCTAIAPAYTPQSTQHTERKGENEEQRHPVSIVGACEDSDGPFKKGV